MNPTGLIQSFSARKRITGPATEYRTLYPICSALEVQSYKNALQLIVKLQKKQPDNYIVLALKAFTLSLSSRPLASTSRGEILQLASFVQTHADGKGLGDPDVLMFFGWVLDSIGRGDETVALLTKATQKHSDNEDVCVEAFLHFIRAGERKLAQQTSLRMHKQFQQEKYLWWSVMTTVLQCRGNLADPTKRLLLSLAERQLSSHFATLLPSPSNDESSAAGIEPTSTDTKGKGKESDTDSSAVAAITAAGSEPSSEPPLETPSITYGTSHEFHLVTSLLTLLASLLPQPPSKNPAPPLILPSLPTSHSLSSYPQKLLAHFGSSEGERWATGDLGLEILRREGVLRFAVAGDGEWEKARERLKGNLSGEEADTNWHTMLYFIRFTFAIAAGTSAPFVPPAPTLGRPIPPAPSAEEETKAVSEGLGEEGRTLIEDAKKLFVRLKEDGEKGRRERGYGLGVLEIERLERMMGWGGEKLGEHVLEYFDRVGTKNCCFMDLKPYFDVLTPEESTKVLETTAHVAEKGSEVTSSLNQLQIAINAAKVARYLSPTMSEAEEEGEANRFIALYFDALPLGKGLPSTELQPADDFALLAAEAFVSAWTSSHNRSYLERAILLLTYALARSAHAFQLRLLLINLLRLVGAPSLALSQYQLLSAKAIQNDTLSHTVLSRGVTFAVVGGAEKSVVEEADKAMKFYRLGEHEANEMPIRAFSYHNYTKVEDFTEFQDRLVFSLSKYQVKLESIRIQLVRGGLTDVSAAEAISTVSALLPLVQKPSVLSDNRDFNSLPSLQAKSAPSIWESTQMGPQANHGWLQALTTVYANFLTPIGIEVAAPASPVPEAELTPSEAALLSFSRNARAALGAALDNTDEENAALGFFKEHETRFVAATQDENTLPWVVLHIAQVLLEAYYLLEFAVEQRIAELTDTRAPDHAKFGKKYRTFRTSARDLAKPLVAKVNAYAKQVGKQRAKTVTGLSSLTTFPVFDEDHLTNLAHSLVESRKAMAEGLASAMHRKFSGK